MGGRQLLFVMTCLMSFVKRRMHVGFLLGGCFPLATLAAPISLPTTSEPPSTPNPHLVGWSNLLVPGLGRGLLGNWSLAAGQFGYETGSFALGYAISPDKRVSNLDGFQSTFKPSTRARARGAAQLNQANDQISGLFYEFSIKTHMLNTYIAYRDAEVARGVTDDLDQTPWWEGFSAPFRADNITDPFVYLPMAAIFAAVAVDFAKTNPSAIQPLTPSTNFLYAANYGFWQPVGSGWPEEAFYRGFLRREFKQMAGGFAWAGILAQSAVFAFSHEPGDGRYGAFVVGTYLGYLADREGGKLSKGIALHFWGNLFLGLETILLNNRAQRASPPGALAVQFNF